MGWEEGGGRGGAGQPVDGSLLRLFPKESASFASFQSLLVSVSFHGPGWPTRGRDDEASRDETKSAEGGTRGATIRRRGATMNERGAMNDERDRRADEREGRADEREGRADDAEGRDIAKGRGDHAEERDIVESVPTMWGEQSRGPTSRSGDAGERGGGTCRDAGGREGRGGPDPSGVPRTRSQASVMMRPLCVCACVCVCVCVSVCLCASARASVYFVCDRSGGRGGWSVRGRGTGAEQGAGAGALRGGRAGAGGRKGSGDAWGVNSRTLQKRLLPQRSRLPPAFEAVGRATGCGRRRRGRAGGRPCRGCRPARVRMDTEWPRRGTPRGRRARARTDSRQGSRRRIYGRAADRRATSGLIGDRGRDERSWGAISDRATGATSRAIGGRDERSGDVTGGLAGGRRRGTGSGR